jgi:hypothetical protein
MRDAMTLRPDAEVTLELWLLMEPEASLRPQLS